MSKIRKCFSIQRLSQKIILLVSFIGFSVNPAMSVTMVKVLESMVHHQWTKKKVEAKAGSVGNHLLFYYPAFFDDFSIWTCEVSLGMKKALLAIRDQLSLNWSITSGPLYLFVRP